MATRQLVKWKLLGFWINGDCLGWLWILIELQVNLAGLIWKASTKVSAGELGDFSEA